MLLPLVLLLLGAGLGWHRLGDEADWFEADWFEANKLGLVSGGWACITVGRWGD